MTNPLIEKFGPPPFSEAVRTKAKQYIDQGRISQDAEQSAVWWVQGSRMDVVYRVQIDRDGKTVHGAVCSCPHGRHVGGSVARCAHVAGVLALVKRAERQAAVDETGESDDVSTA